MTHSAASLRPRHSELESTPTQGFGLGAVGLGRTCSSGRLADSHKATLLEMGGTRIRALGQAPQPGVSHPCPSASLCSHGPLSTIHARAPPPAYDLPRGPSCHALPEPCISLQPRKFLARGLDLKVQVLKKTVTSRERRVTEAARALQATAQAVLHKAEPFTQVGPRPSREAPGGGWGCPTGDLGLGSQGREERRSAVVPSIPPVSPRKLQRTSESTRAEEGRVEVWREAGRTDGCLHLQQPGPRPPPSLIGQGSFIHSFIC